MRNIKGFLRKFDVFGVPYSFKYKSKEKYYTSIGGFFTLLFIALALFFGIYNFLPFYNKKNFTAVYYVLKLDKTEQVYFDKSKVAFSIGLNCWTGSDGTKADDLFDVIHKYIYYDVENGEYVKHTDYVDTHSCTHADFYNEYNVSFDNSKVYDYQCLNDISKAMEGIYTSPIFSYYEFNVNAKNNSKKLLNKIESYLIENDCKLQIFFIDKTIDIRDYKNPIKGYLETVFIQLNPLESIRRNMYFMNQHLYDDNYLIFTFNDDNTEEDQISSLYSRYEEYALYQGLNRTNSSSDYLNWVKIFFRADTRKTDVKRKYQKIMEFYADASSIMVAIYEILIIIFNYINTFYAELSLSKKLFFFKELNNNHLDINKHSKQINALFSLTNQCSNNYKFFNQNEQEKELDYNKCKNTSEISEINNNIKKKGDDINIIKHNNNHNNIKNKKK